MNERDPETVFRKISDDEFDSFHSIAGLFKDKKLEVNELKEVNEKATKEIQF